MRFHRFSTCKRGNRGRWTQNCDDLPCYRRPELVCGVFELPVRSAAHPLRALPPPDERVRKGAEMLLYGESMAFWPFAVTIVLSFRHLLFCCCVDRFVNMRLMTRLQVRRGR